MSDNGVFEGDFMSRIIYNSPENHCMDVSGWTWRGTQYLKSKNWAIIGVLYADGSISRIIYHSLMNLQTDLGGFNSICTKHSMPNSN